MSFFALLLLFILGYFILWPLLRAVWRIRAAQRNFRDMMSGASAGFGGGVPSDAGERKAGWSDKPRKPKKISSDTGEYVAFEEITVTDSQQTTVNADGSTDFVHEQQIVDVEWEELK